MFYWRPGGLVSGSCAHSDQVTISALAQRAAENRVTGVGWYLNHAAASQQGLSEVSIERLGAGAEVPLTLVLDVGRRTPPGTYHVELALAGDSSERIPLTVHVLPSFGLMALLGLVTSIPFALGWALVAGFLRRGGRPKRGDHA